MTGPRPLSRGPLIAFYGDDFTGSSASMEATAFAGLETVLFLAPPTPERLRSFAGARVIGIAGVARAQNPQWMDENLPGVFDLLAATGAPVVHYKVCSTFDSAPHVGSIGRAIEIAAKRFDGWTPMIVADPGMGRYQAGGNLFAAVDGAVHRLDRHPVMSRHPVTPMDEADLGRHLASQTGRKVGLVDFVSIKRGGADAELQQELAAGAKIISIDVLDQETLIEAGRLVWEHGGSTKPLFGVGSQGFEGALVAYWQDCGLWPAAKSVFRAEPVDRIACVSGSVSPVTAAQIVHAKEQGFATISLDAARAVDPMEWDKETMRAAETALAALGAGKDTLVYSAAGPDDPAVASLRAAIASTRASAEAVNERIGMSLGAILDRILAKSGLTRVVISGGDTSGRVASMLGIDALRAIAPLAPGSPLCRAYSSRSDRDGLEIALKGGQVGGPDFFVAAKKGGGR
jgi:3-oxoisoapionate kinase